MLHLSKLFPSDLYGAASSPQSLLFSSLSILLKNGVKYGEGGGVECEIKMRLSLRCAVFPPPKKERGECVVLGKGGVVGLLRTKKAHSLCRNDNDRGGASSRRMKRGKIHGQSSEKGFFLGSNAPRNLLCTRMDSHAETERCRVGKKTFSPLFCRSGKEFFSFFLLPGAF